MGWGTEGEWFERSMENFLIILFGVAMLFVATTSRIEGYINVLAAQGLLLFFLVLLDAPILSFPALLFLAFETLAIKTIAIPLFLRKIVREHGLFREIEPYIPSFYSLFITSLIFAFGFVIAYWESETANSVRALYFGISIATIITGLFIIITRKKILTHVMGYMLLENGIFLLSLAIAKEMPFIVSLGVLLDIFAGIYLLGLFATQVQSTFSEMNIDRLTNLKD